VIMIPLRGGRHALGLRYSLNELLAVHGDPNRVLEEAWAGLLSILVRNWPDWPIEVWVRLAAGAVTDDPTDDEEAGWDVEFAVSFADQGPDSKDVTAMIDAVTRGLKAVLQVEGALAWTRIDPDWNPMWAVDDGQVYRLLAPEPTIEQTVYLIGSYAGVPSMFASTLEAWPLARARRKLGVELADVDTGWAFDA